VKVDRVDMYNPLLVSSGLFASLQFQLMKSVTGGRRKAAAAAAQVHIIIIVNIIIINFIIVILIFTM